MIDTMQPPRRAVVFGAGGGIGGALIAALAEQGWEVAAGSRSGAATTGTARAFAFDLEDEASIAAAASGLRDFVPSRVFVATGALTLPGGAVPEKSYRQLAPGAMAEAFRINAIGPALIAKHMLPLLPRAGRSVFAALGARVGSIGDNRLGGWHSYRASKAALAMLLRTLAIEAARSHPQAIIVGLHPGTVATALSAPFRRSLEKAEVFTPQQSAQRLLEVVEGLQLADSGQVFDWAGAVVPP